VRYPHQRGEGIYCGAEIMCYFFNNMIKVAEFFTELIVMIFALAVVIGLFLLLASPFLLVGWIGWLVIG